MALRPFWIGTTGPFYYDPEEVYPESRLDQIGVFVPQSPLRVENSETFRVPIIDPLGHTLFAELAVNADSGYYLLVAGGVDGDFENAHFRPLSAVLDSGGVIPLTTEGDILVHDGDNPVRLPIGDNGDSLQVKDNAVGWHPLRDPRLPSSSSDDEILVSDGNGGWEVLTGGSNGQVLTMHNGRPAWRNPPTIS